MLICSYLQISYILLVHCNFLLSMLARRLGRNSDYSEKTLAHRLDKTMPQKFSQHVVYRVSSISCISITVRLLPKASVSLYTPHRPL